MNDFVGFDALYATNDEHREKELVAKQLWREVSISVQEVIKAHDVLGFLEFHLKANPSIEEMELSLSAVSGALSGLVSSENLTYDVVRDLANCLQSVHLIRRTFVSIKQLNQAEYDDCIRKLRAQHQSAPVV